MSRRLPVRRDMWKRNEELIITDQVRSNRHASHLGTATGTAGLRLKHPAAKGCTDDGTLAIVPVYILL
jgi:hypothetical protein